jgi:hypothetical protein
MAYTQAFASGRNTQFRVYFAGQPKTLFIKSWAVKEVAVEVKDDVNGELRARLDTITEYFDCNFECYDDSNTALLESLLACIANDDAFNPQVQISQGLIFRYQDGATVKAFTLNGAVRPPIDLKSGGRTERLMHTCHFRATDFAQVVAA